jgi:hypothetical protein
MLCVELTADQAFLFSPFTGETTPKASEGETFIVAQSIPPLALLCNAVSPARGENEEEKIPCP